jgi:hypothetical protein
MDLSNKLINTTVYVLKENSTVEDLLYLVLIIFAIPRALVAAWRYLFP